MTKEIGESVVKWVSGIVTEAEAIKLIGEGKERICKAYAEILSGYKVDPSQILKEVKKVDNYQGLICERRIPFMSLCQHHFLPFFGEISIVYEPGESIIGVGKLSRFVQVYAKRLQLQETLIQQIAKAFMKFGRARGVFVLSKAKHLCMYSRGPNDQNAEVVCSYALGSLSHEEKQNQARNLIGT